MKRLLVSVMLLLLLGAIVNVAVAFGVAYRISLARFDEPTPVNDLTRFSRAYFDLHPPINSTGDAECLVRNSWRLDEYGLRASRDSGRGRQFLVLWEEYGIPFRCVQSPLGMDPEHGWEVVRRLHVVPIPFAINTLMYALLLYVLLWTISWIMARHRH